jgi:uncharacterized protein (TIGR03083 family)
MRVEFDVYLDHIVKQAAALRAAAVTAGPEAEVSPCPGWTVLRLVRHIARVHSWVVQAIDADPAGEPPKAQRPPEEWAAALDWWDETAAAMVSGLRERGPDGPAWAFLGDPTAGFWARRQAHETAIHRLDAEHALRGADVDPLLFDADLAADGIDEVLTSMVPGQVRRHPIEVEGTVLFHAADAGRAWLVTLRPGDVPEVGPATELDTDAAVVGTADAVYRAAWHRPSSAVVTGDRALVAALRTP